MYFLTGIHWWLVTKTSDGRLSPMQTTANVNC